MKYVSTRGEAPALSFEDTMLTGLAPDGGLYVPETVPVLSKGQIARMRLGSYEDAAYDVMAPFVGDTFSEDEFRELIAAAYEEFGHVARAPLKQIDSGLWLLELFHGPTLAFKDFAMQLIGQMFQAVLKRNGRRITIVGATSGDTGSAAIEAFRGLENVDVCILYPHGRVSEVQRRQMTTPVEANVHALAVDGTFDDCQRHLKDMFADHAFRDEVGLAAVNSINWARVMAQIVYYFTSAVSLGAPERRVSFTVPTGNFGDIYAGEIARRMGLPIDRLVVATNQNDILDRAFRDGEYRTGTVMPSISPSMDIQVSSNFERLLFDAYGRDGGAVAQLMQELRSEGGFTISQGAHEAICEHFSSGAVSEEETSARIAATLAESQELVCPHTAVGLEVARDHQDIAVPMIALATAHPAKFPDAVEAATEIRPPLPNRMADLYDRSERVSRVENDLGAIQGLIREKRAK
ncbi:MAG: threonine synthase [Silicimonas sp.]|nr:threonine synthase [Silicimonas sp.]